MFPYIPFYFQTELFSNRDKYCATLDDYKKMKYELILFYNNRASTCGLGLISLKFLTLALFEAFDKRIAELEGKKYNGNLSYLIFLFQLYNSLSRIFPSEFESFNDVAKSLVNLKYEKNPFKKAREVIFEKWKKVKDKCENPAKQRKYFVQLIKHLDKHLKSTTNAKPNGLKKPVVVPRDRGRLRVISS